LRSTPGAALDESLSRDSRYLYVLVSAGPFASDTIEAYTVNSDGTITHIGTSSSFEGSAIGSAAS